MNHLVLKQIQVYLGAFYMGYLQPNDVKPTLRQFMEYKPTFSTLRNIGVKIDGVEIWDKTTYNQKIEPSSKSVIKVNGWNPS